MNSVIISGISMGAIGAFFGISLYIASKKLAVEKDPRLEKIEEALPQANCGACGFAGCGAYAKAVLAGDTELNKMYSRRTGNN